MLDIDLTVRLDANRDFTRDQLGDLLEVMIDDSLDDRTDVIDPTISTYQPGPRTALLTLHVTVDTSDIFEAQTIAFTALRDAFAAAMPATAGMTRQFVEFRQPTAA